MISNIQKLIIELKKENDVLILAHSYQSPEIQEIADAVGDSFALSTYAMNYPHKTVVLCGVKFMAETVKILSPEKKVNPSYRECNLPYGRADYPAGDY